MHVLQVFGINRYYILVKNNIIEISRLDLEKLKLKIKLNSIELDALYFSFFINF